MGIKIVEVSDKYINYMKNYFYKTMMDNKTNYRKHSRKYIGVILKINNYNYFAPLSSPKKSDYINSGNIRKSSAIILRMIENKADGSRILLGTIKLNNMLPVPDTEINNYDLDNEIDKNYKNLIINELFWIEKNTNLIINAAKHLYGLKTHEKENINESNRRFFNSIIPFKDAEIKCLEFKCILKSKIGH